MVGLSQPPGLWLVEEDAPPLSDQGNPNETASQLERHCINLTAYQLVLNLCFGLPFALVLVLMASLYFLQRRRCEAPEDI